MGFVHESCSSPSNLTFVISAGGNSGARLFCPPWGGSAFLSGHGADVSSRFEAGFGVPQVFAEAVLLRCNPGTVLPLTSLWDFISKLYQNSSHFVLPALVSVILITLFCPCFVLVFGT